MTLTSLWCAVSTVQSHTSLLRSWVQWWPLTSGLAWWAPSASKYRHQNLPHWLPCPLQAQAPNGRNCHHSPHMSPSSRRHLDVINPWALTHLAALLPPQPRRPRHQPTLLCPRATARRSLTAAAQEHRLIPKVSGEGTAVHHLWLSASNRSHRSWIRCTSMMVSEKFLFGSILSVAFQSVQLFKGKAIIAYFIFCFLKKWL